MSKHFEHSVLGLAFDLPDLKQRDVEAFYAAMREMDPGWRRLPSSELAGHYVRAAATAGWLPGVKADEVGDWDPAKARWLGGLIDEHVAGAVTVPKEPSVSPSPTIATD